MLVLAIDTALAACSAAVLDADRGTILARESEPMRRGQAEILVPMVARVMSRAGLQFGALGRVAVTVGPGSFTGLRVGIAAARGISLAAGKPAVGLSTLAAFAAPHIAADDTAPVIAAIDARHDHVYLQVFGPEGRTLVSPRIASLREAIRTGPAPASLAPRPPHRRDRHDACCGGNRGRHGRQSVATGCGGVAGHGCARGAGD
jgi:tRNA threonylcarbamoyladenosine biosynthesis protein TsaB